MVQTEFRDALIDRSRSLMTQARAYLDASIAQARASTEQVANALDRLEAPVKTLHTAGTRFTEVTQRYAATMLGVQAAAVEAALEDGAARLRIAAKAGSLRSLVQMQVDRLPSSRNRITSDWRSATAATTEIGRELRDLAGETYTLLTARSAPRKGTAQPKRRAAARKTRKTSRTSTRRAQRSIKRAPARKSRAVRTRATRKTA